MRYAVRCCCQPTKVLGWLDGPEDVHSFFVLETRRRGGLAPPPQHEVKVRDMCSCRIVEHPELCEANGDVPVELVRMVERAIYSDDRPIEFWRRIAGFEAA
jgi:hypothetical protein